MQAMLPRLLVACCVLGFVTASQRGRAERYLLAEEASKLVFPEADRFEAQALRFTPEQAQAIARKSGVPVRLAGHRWWIARSGTNILGVVVVDHVIGKHEIIDYAVGIDTAGAVRQIEILEYRESHGSEIRGKKWRAQFRGKNAGAPLKLNDDIYNISGATLSCRHVTEGVRRVLATFDLVLRSRLGGNPGGVPEPAP